MKNVKAILAIVTLLIVTAGCDGEEYLTSVTPSSDEGPGQGEWQSVQDLEYLASGGYWNTSGECCGGNQVARAAWAGTLPTDIPVDFQDAGDGYFLDGGDIEAFYRRNSNNPDNSELNRMWKGAYSAISISNNGISFIEENFLNNEGEPPFEDPNSWTPRLYGEFKFLRAFNYYILAKTFAPPYSQENLSKESVIIRTKQTDGFTEANKPLGTVEELYTLIVSDLQDAIANLPEQPRSGDPPQYNYSRVTKPAARLLLARVSFDMQNWGQAKQLATEVIEDSRFQLNEDPIVAWEQADFVRPNEVIWYYQWVDGDGVGRNSNWKWPREFISWNALRANWGQVSSIENNRKRVACSYSFLNKVGWINMSDTTETQEAQDDLRYTQLYKRFEAGDNSHGLEFNRPTVWINKYYRNPDYPQTTNQPLFRVSEMYLTRAIISFLGGNGASQDMVQALNDVNAIRQRAGLDALLPTELTEEAIHNERMKERAFEGDRLAYLQALRMDIPNGDRGSGSIPWNDESLVYPIPTSETDFNNALK